MIVNSVSGNCRFIYSTDILVFVQVTVQLIAMGTLRSCLTSIGSVRHLWQPSLWGPVCCVLDAVDELGSTMGMGVHQVSTGRWLDFSQVILGVCGS